MATMQSWLNKRWLLVCAFLSNLFLQTLQETYGLTSYCVENSINDIQFGARGDSSYGIFKMATNDDPDYRLGLNCTVKLSAPQGYKLHLAFSEISTRSCNLDKIVVSTSENGNGTVLCGHRNCPAENCDHLQFDSAHITVHFTTSTNITKDYKELTGFTSMITVFSHANDKGNCYTTDQFRCRNRNCIWKGLFCNKHNHCGDDSDEPLGCKPFASQTPWGIVVIILGVLSFCFFLPLFCIITIKGRRQEVKVFRSSYQPIPTSINTEDSQVFNTALILNENMPTYQFYDTASASSSPETTPIHSGTKDSKFPPYQNV